MKKIIATHLILLTLLLGLTVAGLNFIDSCKSRLFIELETIQGDASYIMDKNIGIQYQSKTDPDVISFSDLSVRFSDGTPRYTLSNRIVDDAEQLEYKQMQRDIYSIENTNLLFRHVESDFKFPDSVCQINQDYESIPQKYDPEGKYGLKLDYIDKAPYNSVLADFITMEGITYTTLSSDLLYSDHYGFTYEKKPETDGFDLDRIYPMEYTIRSGIWAFDETDPEATLQNVVPYQISGLSGSEVSGIYAIEKERAIVLVTIENKTDLYATVYDTKTETAREPVLIFHSDSGEIEAHILPNNDSCPMGSIYVVIPDREDQTQSKAFALSLQKNKSSGAIESICYPFPSYEPLYSTNQFARYSTSPFVFVFVDRFSSDQLERFYFYFPELFYFGNEVWMTSIDLNEVSSNRKGSYPESLSDLSAGSFVRRYLIRGYEGETLFYEGMISVDSSLADPDASIDRQNNYISDAPNVSKNEHTRKLSSDTRLTLTIE